MSRRVGNTSHAVVLAVVVLCAGVLTACNGGTAQDVRVAGQRMVAIASDVDEFSAIFQRDPTMSEASGLSKLVKDAKSAGLEVLSNANGRRQASRVFGALDDPSVDYVTLVGHNSDGEFRFADESAITLSQLDPPEGKIVAVISCESALHIGGTVIGVPDELTYPVAFRTEQLFAAGLTADMLSDPTAAQQLLEQSFHRAVAESNVKRLAIVGVVGVPAVGGVVGVAIVSQP